MANLRYLDKLSCVGLRAMHLVAASACICDLEPGALLLPSKASALRGHPAHLQSPRGG